MRALAGLFTAVVLLVGCKGETSEQVVESPVSKKEIVEFGAGVVATSANSTGEMIKIYSDLKDADTLNTAFEATVTEVCQMKGCWMKLDLGNEQTAMVRFKDYGFFMPKDLAGKRVVVEGKAFVELVSVEDQRHYAEDAGSTPEEIEAITASQRTYSFEAAGVKIK